MVEIQKISREFRFENWREPAAEHFVALAQKIPETVALSGGSTPKLLYQLWLIQTNRFAIRSLVQDSLLLV